MDQCIFNSCDRPKKNKKQDHCEPHYRQILRGQPLRPLRGLTGYGRKGCDFDGCDNPHKGKGYCQGHLRQINSGKLLSPIRERNTGWLDPNGYRLISISGKIIRQHRYIMEQHLGRELLPEETVHHLNGVRDDNRLENLELWSSSHPSGQRIGDKLEWCYDFISKYKDFRRGNNE